ncbi:MAG: hypothetical protein LBJ46_05115 [Planctomycetota bacterium]|jgi:hypothetical protein|nr:hypothetical protein [Planctomycetota bacterium]
MTDADAVGLPPGEDVDYRKSATKGAILAIVAGILAGWALSFAYSPLCHHIPLLSANFLVAMAFGYVTGMIVRAVVRLYRIDKAGLAFVAGAIAGVVTWWLSWVSYLWVLFDYDFTAYWSALTHPLDIIDFMRYFSINPVWTAGESEMPAFVYYLVWLGECALLAGLAARMPYDLIKSNRLCATCHDWLARTGDVVNIVPAFGGVKAADVMKRGEIDLLADFPRLSDEELEKADSWVAVTAFACPNCAKSDAFVDVDQFIVARDKKGGGKQKSSTVLKKQVPVSREFEATMFSSPAPAPVPEPGPEAGTGEPQ